ncbi:MAG: type II secretion system protein [Patescibacteria group bacterium]
MKGYTLIELIIYVAVLGLIAVAFGSLTISIAGSTGRTSGSANLEESLHMVMEQLADSFAVSNIVQFPSAGASDSYLALINAETFEITSFGLSGATIVRGVNGFASTTISDPSVTITTLSFVHRNTIGRRDHVGVYLVGRTDREGGNALEIPITTSFVTAN